MSEETENTLSIEHSITHSDRHLQLCKPHCVQAAGFHAQEGVHNRMSKSIHSWKEQRDGKSTAGMSTKPSEQTLADKLLLHGFLTTLFPASFPLCSFSEKVTCLSDATEQNPDSCFTAVSATPPFPCRHSSDYHQRSWMWCGLTETHFFIQGPTDISYLTGSGAKSTSQASVTRKTDWIIFKVQNYAFTKTDLHTGKTSAERERAGM